MFLSACVADATVDETTASSLDEATVARDTCDHAGLTLALDVLGSPISADVLERNQEQQTSTLTTLWNAPETQRALAPLQAAAAAKDAALVVTRFQSLPFESWIQAEVFLAEVQLGAEPVEIGSLILRRRTGATATEVRFFASDGPADGCGTLGDTTVLDVLGSPVSADVFALNQADQSATLTPLWTSKPAQTLLASLYAAAEPRGAVVMATRQQALSRRGPLGNLRLAEVEVGEWSIASEETTVIGTVLLRRDGNKPVTARFVPAPR